MEILAPSSNSEGKCVSLILLSLLCILIYSNTFGVSWKLDDYPNILSDPALHFDQISLDSIFNVFYSPSSDAKGLYRPISRLSFAINWFFHQDDVAGYHFVNIAIHVLNTLFLFFSLLLLFKTPRLNSRYPDFESRFFIAFLATAFWAVHPIQTQAVTYIVQRMTSLAALFYILGILFYMKARLAAHLFQKIIFYFLCIASYIFAIGSKENAIMLPISLALMETIFFQDLFDPKIRKKIGFWIFLIFLFFTFFSLFILNLVRDNGLAALLQAYDHRPFSLNERLMTQPRVLLFYLYQIFYPKLNNYSIMQDFDLSSSLFDPWTTLPAMFLLFFAVFAAFIRADRNPLFSFAILFYFVNHLIESSFIPLEMAFEHRNYLPSMFLFLPFSIGAFNLIQKFNDRPAMGISLAFSISLLLLIFGLSTYQRNMVWATDFSLWEDAYQKAPRLARPAHNLAAAIYDQDSSQYALALELNRQALSRIFMRSERKAQTFFNMGVIYHQIGNIPRSMESFRQAIMIMPDHEKSIYNLSMLLANTEDWEQALGHVNRLISHYPRNPSYHALRGRILFEMARFEFAMESFRSALNLDMRHGSALLYLGVLCYISEDHRKADFFLERAIKGFPENLDAWLWWIENRIQLKGVEATKRNIEILFEKFSIGNIQRALKSPQIQFGFSSSLNTLLNDFLVTKAESLVVQNNR